MNLFDAVSCEERLARELCAGYRMMLDRMPRTHPNVIRDVEANWECWLGEARRVLALGVFDERQTMSEESGDDWEVTLATILLEEDIKLAQYGGMSDIMAHSLLSHVKKLAGIASARRFVGVDLSSAA